MRVGPARPERDHQICLLAANCCFGGYSEGFAGGCPPVPSHSEHVRSRCEHVRSDGKQVWREAEWERNAGQPIGSGGGSVGPAARADGTGRGKKPPSPRVPVPAGGRQILAAWIDRPVSPGGVTSGPGRPGPSGLPFFTIFPTRRRAFRNGFKSTRFPGPVRRRCRASRRAGRPRRFERGNPDSNCRLRLRRKARWPHGRR